MLQGYFAGNPMTDDRFDTAGKIQFFHGMGVIPNELYEIAKENCRGNYSDPPSASCAESMQAIDIKKVSNTTTQTRNCTLLKRMDPWLKLREPRNHLKLNWVYFAHALCIILLRLPCLEHQNFWFTIFYWQWTTVDKGHQLVPHPGALMRDDMEPEDSASGSKRWSESAHGGWFFWWWYPVSLQV